MVLTVAACALLGACRGYGDVSKAVELDEDDNGTTVRAVETEMLIITLTSNQSTGYHWELTEKPSKVLELVASDYEVQDDTDGGGGVEIWRFGVREAGSTALELGYVGPDGGDPVRTFSIDVVATGTDP